MGYLGKDADEFTDEASRLIKRFKIVETVRIQDFHRKPVTFKPNSTSILGPIKMKTSSQKGSVVGMSIDSSTGGLNEVKFRNASIKYDRPLIANGLCIEDHELNELVQIDIAVEEYIIDIHRYLSSIHPSLQKSLSKFCFTFDEMS